MCGGAVTPGTPVSEQYLLDLEREAFLSLCGEKKTQERIAFTLKTGKPLRIEAGRVQRGEPSDGRGSDAPHRRCRMKDAVIVSAVRTAVGKAPKGTLRATRPDDLARGRHARARSTACRDLDSKRDRRRDHRLRHAGGGAGNERGADRSLRAGLPIEAAAMTVNRFCASGLQSIALAAERIRGGGADVIVAGGAESMSFVPMGGNKISVNPWLMEHYPDSYLSMGLTAERVAQHYGITAARRPIEFALASHQKALAAQAAGRFRGRNRAGAGLLRSARRAIQAEKTEQRVQRSTRARAPTLRSKRWPSSSRRFTRKALLRRATARRRRMAQRQRW